MPEQTDLVAERLKRAPLPNSVRAQLWDLYHASANEDDFATALQTAKVPRSIAADLWDIKVGVAKPQATSAPAAVRTHPMARLGQQVVDVGKGAAAGLASTIYHGGDLIRRATGQERIIDQPDIQTAITPPDSAGGTIGFYGEQAAEFAVPLSKVATASKALSVPARMGLEAAAASGVAGIQSGGDQATMAVGGVLGALAPPVGAAGRWAGRTARNAAAGANDGGLGGAVAGALRTAAPLEPRRMLTQALKPRSVKVRFDSALDRAMPEIKASESTLGKPVAGLEDFLAATGDAKKRVWSQYEQMAGPHRKMGATVDLSPVGAAMERSIPSKVRLEEPGKVKAITARAKAYQRRFSLEEAETLLKETNAELDAFYDKYPAAQRSAQASNPEIAHTVAQAKTLRAAIDRVLDAPGEGAAAREVKRRYGALLEVENEAFRRLNVAKRQQPESLAEQIAQAGAVGDLARGAWKLAHGNLMGAADIASARAQRAGAKFLKEQQTTDALIRRAMAGFSGKSAPIAIPTPLPLAAAEHLPLSTTTAVVATPDPAVPTTPKAVDLIDTGEQQPRLPEAGHVREQELPTPEFEAPFSLASEVSTAPQGVEQELFRTPVNDIQTKSMPKANASAKKIAEGPIWGKTLLDARKNGYQGTEAELREKFTARVRQAQSLQAELESAESQFGHTALLAEIRRMGGLKPFTKDVSGRKLRGDFASIVESFGATSTRGQRGGASIFRQSGMDFDEMARILSEDPKWKHVIKEGADLLEVLDEIAREGGQESRKSLEHYLKATGVQQGAKWWLTSGLLLPLAAGVPQPQGQNHAGQR